MPYDDDYDWDDDGRSYDYDDWDPCDLHEYLETFRTMSKRER